MNKELAFLITNFIGMNTDILKAIKNLCDEKGISMEAVISTIELALAAAYRKDFGSKQQNIKVVFDPETADFEVFDVKTVVEIEIDPETEEPVVRFVNEEGEEETRKFNPKAEIVLEEAKGIDPNAEIGGEVKVKLEVPGAFGRMAAQTAKQVIIQRIREAERDTIYEEYKGKEGEMLSGVVQRVEGVTVMLDFGKAVAVLPISEQMRGEYCRLGQRMKVVVLEVRLTPKGPEIIVSRAHPKLVEKLFEAEVPEIASGTVEVKAIAREPGSRTKIAVMAHEQNIDPIGSCVGQRGNRVQTVMNELGGEKIDIIEYREDTEGYLAQALSPAKIHHVEITDSAAKEAKVYVKELSLAIGKGGQNVRLAAKLTGYKIDIVEYGAEVEAGAEDPETEHSEEEAKKSGEEGVPKAEEQNAGAKQE